MPDEQYTELSTNEAPVPIGFRTLLRTKAIHDRWEYEEDNTPLLRRVLTRLDILSFGSCMTLGAGIFVTSGVVAKTTGPAVVLSFMLSGVAALIASLAYSEFASRATASGSTYSYVYISLGEFLGWTAGWVTILEYTGAAAIAHSIAQMCITVARSLEIADPSKSTENQINKLIATILIATLTVFVLYIGIKNSARFCRIMSVANVTTIVFMISAGSIYAHKANWADFAPNKFTSIVQGAARVFFAYIGFENSTTLATEVKDPKRYMPFGIIFALSIAVLFYMASSLVITGMVLYTEIDIDHSAPFVSAFEQVGQSWMAGVVGIGSLLCMITTIFTILVGLPRILFQMSKDGLLGERFSFLNKHKVPHVGTLLFAFVACAVAGLGNLIDVTDMICCGVLINYSMVNMGIISLRFMDNERKMTRRHVRLLITTVFSCILVGLGLRCKYYVIVAPACLLPFLVCMVLLYRVMPVHSLAHPPNVNSFLTPFVPFLPCVGTLLNIVMMLQLNIHSLWQVLVWIGLGSIIYFAYGIRHSKLNQIRATDQFYY